MSFRNWFKGAKAKALVALGSFALLLGVGASVSVAQAAKENEVVETKAASNAPSIYYLDPGCWNTGSAWFGAWFSGGSIAGGGVFKAGTKDDASGLYTILVPDRSATGVDFLRMASSSSWGDGSTTYPTKDANGYWNRASGLSISSSTNNKYTVEGWDDSGSFGSMSDKYYIVGDNSFGNWNVVAGNALTDVGTSDIGGRTNVSVTNDSTSFKIAWVESNTVQWNYSYGYSARDGKSYTFIEEGAEGNFRIKYAGSYDFFLTTSLKVYLTRSITITFNANGGTVATNSKVVAQSFNGSSSNKYGELPTPTREHYSFAGWYTAQSGGTQITATSSTESLTADQELFAHWTADTYVVTVSAHFFRGGVDQGNASLKSAQATYGETFAMPVDPVNYPSSYDFADGRTYSFVGWYSDVECETPFTSSTSHSSGFTVFGRYENNIAVVTFNANGGKWTDEDTTKTSDVTIGNKASAYGTSPGRYGNVFAHWSTTTSGSAFDFAHTTINDDLTLYAVWNAAATYTFKVDFGPIKGTWGTATPMIYIWDAYGDNGAGGVAASDAGAPSVYGTVYQFTVPQNATAFVIGNHSGSWTYKSQDLEISSANNGKTYVLTETTSTSHSGAYRCNGSWMTPLAFTKDDDGITTNYAFYSGIAFNLPAPTGKTGYSATSWNNNPTGAGTSYTLGQSVTFAANTTLYVIYTQHGYYVVGDTTYTGGATPMWSELTGTRLSSATSGTDHAAGTSIRIPGSAQFRIKYYENGTGDYWCEWGDGGYPTSLFNKVGNNLQNKSSSEVVIDIYVNSADKVYIVDETDIEAAGYLYYASDSAKAAITLTATNGNNTTIDGYLANVAQVATASSTLRFDSKTYLYKIPVYNLRGVYTYAKVTSITIAGTVVSLEGITQEDSKKYYIVGSDLYEPKATAAEIAWGLAESIAGATNQSLCALDKSTLTTFKSNYVALTDSGAKALLNSATINTYQPDGNSYDAEKGPKITTKTNVSILTIYNYVNGHYNAETGKWTLGLFGPAANPEASPLTLTLWIVLGAGVLGLGAIGTAYFVSKKKRHQA